MRDPDALALYDALPPDERAALDRAVAEQPALAEAFARWQSLRAEVRAELARDLPDRALLVLYALSDEDLLSDAERAELDAARPALDDALARHPGLAAAVGSIRADRDAFEAAWAEAAGADAAPARPVPLAAPIASTADAGAPVPSRSPAPSASRPATRAASDRPAAQRTHPARWVWRATALAAVVAFGVVLTTLWTRDAGWETVVADGARTVTFADGSTARLADGARLAVPTDDLADGRQARLLAGRALFRVEKDAADPFDVTTPNAEVTVLGTTFTVDATDVQTEVVLVSGAVRLAPRARPDAAVTLAPGERSAVLALDAPSAPERADLGALDWTGTVFARGLTVGELAARLARQFDETVAVDPALAGEPISDGEYGADGLRDALDKITRATGARLVMEGNGFRLRTD